jgi:electron transfer flavoprotein alpha subunit
VEIGEADIFVHETAVAHNPSETKSIEDASIVIAGGNGFKTKEDFMLLYDLAELLGGVVGATRPVVNKGWISKEYQIGQSGKTISPRCYLAFGISGAIQHTVGISGAELFVAVNTDEKAEIFGEAGFGIVADCVSTVKAMISELSNTDKAVSK